jgi:hypothetical protein
MEGGGQGASRALGWVVLLVAVIFGLGYAYDRGSERREAREARVFDLAREYRMSLRLTNAQFSARWNEFLNDSIDPYNGGNLDQQSFAALVNQFLAMDSNRDSYETLAGYYETVGECVQARLCDFWTARMTLGNDIVVFYHNMYPALAEESQQGRSDAGIIEFARRMRAADRGEIAPSWSDWQ